MLACIFGLGYLVNIMSVYFVAWCVFNGVVAINFLKTFMNLDVCEMIKGPKSFLFRSNFYG